MIHEILPVGMLQCNCSIYGDEASKQALVIDPGDDVETILSVIEKHGLTVKAIVITHAHIDHIGGAARLRQATGAPVYMNENDMALAERLDAQAQWLGTQTPPRPEIDTAAREGDVLRVGAMDAHVLHTPGHTQGSICLFVPADRKLFAGDTLFRDSIGRTDLPGGNSRQILTSIHAKLLPLDEDTEVVPGHGPVTTIGREKRFNWFLR
jgi:glyoxylase-like metal-dependent hydrolase (beta-lactamase superfamily II)